MHAFIVQECQPTPFAYQWLKQQESGCVLCIPCLNWKRRCVNHRLEFVKRRVKRMAYILPPSEKQFLPIDQMILFCVMPGRYHMPDKRSFERLLTSLGDPENPILPLLPVNIQYILRSIQYPTVMGALEAWWKVNNQTHVMRYPVVAKMIRGMLKRSDDETTALENMLEYDI